MQKRRVKGTGRVYKRGGFGILGKANATMNPRVAVINTMPQPCYGSVWKILSIVNQL